MTDAAVARWLAMSLAAICGVLIAWRLREVELLLFGAILFGVFFEALAAPLRQRLHLSAGWALAAAVLIFLIVLLGAIAFFGVKLQGQAVDLAHSLPAAWSRFRTDISGTPIGSFAGQDIDRLGREALGTLGAKLRAYALTGGQGLLGLLLMVVAGIYLAARPQPYRRGLLRLVPRPQTPKVERFLDMTGHILRRWLLAEAAAMLIVGLLTGFGLWAIGVPAAGALGVIAAVGEFVPMVGVLVASAPAVLLAAMQGWPMVIWTVVLLTAIHQFQGNVVQPILQRGLNSVPPVVTLFALVGFGAFLGFLGLLFAVPLALVLLGAARVWLGDHDDPERSG